MFNKSTWFLLPMVGLQFDPFIRDGVKVTTDLNQYYLYNTYLDEQNKKLYIICEDSQDEKYRKLLQLLEFNSNLERLSTKDNLTTICFNIPEKWENDIIIFLSGKYTKLSEEYKQLLIRKYDIRYNVHKILYPKPADIQKLKSTLYDPMDDIHPIYKPVKIEEIYPIVDIEKERFKDMFIVLKSSEDKYKDVAVALYDSVTGSTKVVFTLNPGLCDNPQKTAQNLVDIINKNINDFDKSNIKEVVKI